MIRIPNFCLYSLEVCANVKIAVQCFEIFGGQMPQMPPWLRAWAAIIAFSGVKGY